MTAEARTCDASCGDTVLAVQPPPPPQVPAADMAGSPATEAGDVARPPAALLACDIRDTEWPVMAAQR